MAFGCNLLQPIFPWQQSRPLGISAFIRSLGRHQVLLHAVCRRIRRIPALIQFKDRAAKRNICSVAVKIRGLINLIGSKRHILHHFAVDKTLAVAIFFDGGQRHYCHQRPVCKIRRHVACRTFKLIDLVSLSRHQSSEYNDAVRRYRRVCLHPLPHAAVILRLQAEGGRILCYDIACYGIGLLNLKRYLWVVGNLDLCLLVLAHIRLDDRLAHHMPLGRLDLLEPVGAFWQQGRIGNSVIRRSQHYRIPFAVRHWLLACTVHKDLELCACKRLSAMGILLYQLDPSIVRRIHYGDILRLFSPAHRKLCTGISIRRLEAFRRFCLDIIIGARSKLRIFGIWISGTVHCRDKLGSQSPLRVPFFSAIEAGSSG